MRVLITGGRDYADFWRLAKVLDGMHLEQPISCLIEGGATGADRLANGWAKRRGIPLETFTADWDLHGKAAGPIRNRRMLAEGKPDLVIAFPGGAGTADMVKQARKSGVHVREIIE
jgi:hypothetical protein